MSSRSKAFAEETRREIERTVLELVYPFARHLPEEEREQFERELEEVVVSWRSAARIHSDAELKAELLRPIEAGGGKVPRPSGGGREASAPEVGSLCPAQAFLSARMFVPRSPTRAPLIHSAEWSFSQR